MSRGTDEKPKLTLLETIACLLIVMAALSLFFLLVIAVGEWIAGLF